MPAALACCCQFDAGAEQSRKAATKLGGQWLSLCQCRRLGSEGRWSETGGAPKVYNQMDSYRERDRDGRDLTIERPEVAGLFAHVPRGCAKVGITKTSTSCRALSYASCHHMSLCQSSRPYYHTRESIHTVGPFTKMAVFPCPAEPYSSSQYRYLMARCIETSAVVESKMACARCRSE